MTATYETPTSAEERILTRSDRCDAACPASATVAVYFKAGALAFCGHHFRALERDLAERARLIVDERQNPHLPVKIGPR